MHIIYTVVTAIISCLLFFFPPHQLEKLIEKNYFLHKSAQEAYKAYIRAYDSHSLKQIYNVNNLDLNKVSLSFGFKVPPFVDLSILYCSVSKLNSCYAIVPMLLQILVFVLFWLCCLITCLHHAQKWFIKENPKWQFFQFQCLQTSVSVHEHASVAAG